MYIFRIFVLVSIVFKSVKYFTAKMQILIYTLFRNCIGKSQCHICLNIVELGLFGTLKLALALQFIVMNTYFSVARTLTLVLHATLK